MERPRNLPPEAEARATSFARFAVKQSGSKFLVGELHSRGIGKPTVGVSINRIDGEEFKIIQAVMVVFTLNLEAIRLGGRLISPFEPFFGDRSNWNGVYGF